MSESTEAYAVVNELSFDAKPASRTALELVRTLGQVLRAMRGAVAHHDRSRVVFKVPPDLGALNLPGGIRFVSALSALSQDERSLILQELLSGPFFDYSIPATWYFENSPAHGLGHAIALSGLAVSLDLPGWKRIDLPVNDPAAAIDGIACNAWQEPLDAVHRAQLAKHVPVLPDYEDDGRHDPSCPKYVNGKSHLPRNARRILRHAIPEPAKGDTWWARCEHGFFHRFSGHPRVHWNGTTNRDAKQVTREEDVPSAVRERLEAMDPARDCGCREVV